MSSLIDRISNKAFDVVSDRAQAKIQDKELKIVIDDIYKQINSIKKKLTQLKPPANNFEGESGDVRVVKNKSNPNRRKSFRARHKCDTAPGPKWKARYWSCKMW